jgi:hypothetical protein
MLTILPVLLMIGGTFGFLGACIAFLVTWNEYYKHHFRGKRLFKEAFKVGMFTFLFFILLSIVVAFVFTKLSL